MQFPAVLKNHVTIRLAHPADAPALALLGAATFLETYAHMIGAEDILAHVAHKHSERIYSAFLADPRTKIWLAETSVKTPIAYLVLCPATLPPDDPHANDLEVLRLYVLMRFHKEGVGRILMEHAIGQARHLNARQVVLGVYHGNEGALAFYARIGFRRVGTRDFTVGNTAFHDLVLGRPV